MGSQKVTVGGTVNIIHTVEYLKVKKIKVIYYQITFIFLTLNTLPYVQGIINYLPHVLLY